MCFFADISLCSQAHIFKVNIGEYSLKANFELLKQNIPNRMAVAVLPKKNKIKKVIYVMTLTAWEPNERQISILQH